MDEQRIIEWLALCSIKGLGIKRQHQLLQKFQTPAAVFAITAEELTQLPRSIADELAGIQQKGLSHPYFQKAKEIVDNVHNNAWHIVSLQCPAYPLLLKQIPWAPPLLYVKGDLSSLKAQQLGVVGARKASQMAINISYQWSKSLASQGVVITSGLALGIDASAHKGALAGNGKTIAVLAHGLDSIYPKSHRSLADEVASAGALVTEFAPGTEVRRDHFPRRNRIISGLSQGILVVEAAIKSGSLITARYALEQNREVFAIPGAISNPMAAGCHYLIKQGAQLTDSTADIFDNLPDYSNNLPLSLSNDEIPNKPDIDTKLNALLTQIPYEFVHFDKLSADTGIRAEVLNGYLLELEVEGLIEANSASFRRI